jgi:hypothetical protein
MAASLNRPARILLFVVAMIWASATRTTCGAPIVVGGDFNLNDRVDGDDVLYWQRHIAGTFEGAARLAEWKNNFGYPNAAPAAVPTPEPGSAALLAGAGGWLVLQGRRRRNPRSLTGG